MIVYKRTDSTLYFGWDFTNELPSGVTVSASSSVKIFDEDAADVSATLLQEKTVSGNIVSAFIKVGGTDLKDYTVIFYAVTTDARVAPVHAVPMLVRDSG